MTHLVLIDVPIISVATMEHWARHMVCLRKTAKAVAVQVTWTHRAILLLFLVLPRHHQWLFEMYWHDMLTLSETSSLREVIINTHDPMRNPGQTQIFYKAGQTQKNVTQLTWMTQPGCSINSDLRVCHACDIYSYVYRHIISDWPLCMVQL